jgi:site-specific DNA recombinase
MNKYIIYCRKSTDEKTKQVLSIEAQIAELTEFAKREQLDIVEIVTEAKTAKIPGRIIFNQVISKIESSQANAILSWHPDRLARNSIDGGKIIYLIDTGKLLDLKFPSFWFDNTPQGKFMLNIAFGQSKYYVDNLSENVKRGNRQKIRNGVWPNKAPLGYDNDRLTKTININPEKSKVVKKAFQLFVNGKSFTQLSQFMAINGIVKGNGQPKSINQIRRMLCKKFYIGILEYAGEKSKGIHQCFIERKLFDQAQDKLDKLNRPRQYGHNFAFSGLIRCGECGASITAEKHTKHYNRTNNNVVYNYYRCTKKIKPCSQPYIPESKLVDQVSKEIILTSLPASWGKSWLKWLEQDRVEEKQSIQQNLFLINQNIQTIDQKLNKLLDTYLDNTIEEKVYKDKKNQLFDQKLDLEEKKVKTETNGSHWLEPFRDFIINAQDAPNIARKKENLSRLSSAVKNIGSNFFLKDKKLHIELKKPFTALRAYGLARRRLTVADAHSLCVTLPGIEPGFLP